MGYKNYIVKRLFPLSLLRKSRLEYNLLGKIIVVSTGLEPQTDVNVKYIASMYGVYVSS